VVNRSRPAARSAVEKQRLDPMMLRSCAALGLLPLINAHGAMLNPPPRNAIDSTLPGDDWGNGTNSTGILER
jgi:hypothetical protein